MTTYVAEYKYDHHQGVWQAAIRQDDERGEVVALTRASESYLNVMTEAGRIIRTLKAGE